MSRKLFSSVDNDSARSRFDFRDIFGRADPPQVTVYQPETERKDHRRA
jgi:hypothetical protein